MFTFARHHWACFAWIVATFVMFMIARATVG